MTFHREPCFLNSTPYTGFCYIPSPFFSTPRLFGLKDIIKPGNCSASYDLILNTEHDWPVYVNPGILLLLYITVATVLKISSHHGSADKVPTSALRGMKHTCLS